MDYLQAIVLALIQGVTEFLPISSSAHLLIPDHLFGWPDQGLAYDTAVHLGSLVAVIIYFRQRLKLLCLAVVTHIRTAQPSQDSRFAINLLIASIPIIPIGYLARFYVEAELRSIEVIAIATIAFGIALWIADRLAQSTERELTPLSALMIGFAQCFALIPGASRAGVTMTMALLLRFSRERAAEISFLMAIPAIMGAATIKLYDLIQSPMTVDWIQLSVATLISGVSAYVCIALFLTMINRIGFTPFVIYRLILGFGILAYLG